MAKQKVLITGASGLIGSKLQEFLKFKGYEVLIVSRKKSDESNHYHWDLNEKKLETGAVIDTDYIIHLAGAGVMDKPWTEQYKKEIIESREASTQLLYDQLRIVPHHVKAFISASAIGYYGLDTGDRMISEENGKGNGFLADVVEKWEKVIAKIEDFKIRVVRLRIGIIMSDKGGALPKMAAPAKLGAGAAIGTGKQYMSWIHIDDFCNMVYHVLDNYNIKGTFNAVAPNPVTNQELSKKISKYLNKPFFLPNIPSFILKLIFGEKALMLLGGNRVSSKKIESTGFRFKYSDIDSTLKDLLGS